MKRKMEVVCYKTIFQADGEFLEASLCIPRIRTKIGVERALHNKAVSNYGDKCASLTVLKYVEEYSTQVNLWMDDSEFLESAQVIAEEAEEGVDENE